MVWTFKFELYGVEKVHTCMHAYITYFVCYFIEIYNQENKEKIVQWIWFGMGEEYGYLWNLKRESDKKRERLESMFDTSPPTSPLVNGSLCFTW